jgi:LPXTG-motif cell wall-anchored protein
MKRAKLERRIRGTLAGAIAAVAIMIALFLGLATPAGAQNYPVPDPSVTTPPPSVSGTSTSKLPTTGSDVIGLTVLGVGLVATGAVVLRVRRHAAPRAA